MIRYLSSNPTGGYLFLILTVVEYKNDLCISNEKSKWKAKQKIEK